MYCSDRIHFEFIQRSPFPKNSSCCISHTLNKYGYIPHKHKIIMYNCSLCLLMIRIQWTGEIIIYSDTEKVLMTHGLARNDSLVVNSKNL